MTTTAPSSLRTELVCLHLLLAFALWVASPRPVPWGLFTAAVAVGSLLIFAGAAMAGRLGHAAEVTTRRLLLAMPIGAALGGVLLLLLSALVPWIPALATRLAQRAGQPWMFPLLLATQASVLEELVFRLFLFTLVVWLAARAWRGRPECIRPAGCWQRICSRASPSPPSTCLRGSRCSAQPLS